MKQTFYFACLLFLCASASFAQSGTTHRCEVAVADPKTKKGAQLGTFTTVIREEELTTKAFPLPHTKLFVVASVFYTDESMASAKGQDSVSLELALSRNRTRNVLRSLNWAEAEVPLNGFDVGRVTMLIKANGRSQLVLMECREKIRP